ncbi:helix-turn-helix domain-containing protein [Schlesneria paludicola]|uniref:helix-turn-helix domain-containing protein n=1 Tax=Schlesneria paludicola TaxID=360056 RepID=UPI000A02D0B6|nr:helix-turn-helix transcriptional regulator [Schlesneria paludicola]
MEMKVNGDAIRRLRTLKAMSQRDLAVHSALSSATISRLESGNNRIQPDTLHAIAKVLQVNVEELLLGVGQTSPNSPSPEAQLAAPSLSVTITPYFHKRELEPEDDLVFVLMPFTEPWSDYIWKEEIKPIVTGIDDHPLRCLRADDLFGHDVMIDIYESIAAARIVIADITGRNANVFYELGIAHTLGKDVILLAQGTVHIPFDLLRFRHCIYSNDGPGYKILRKYLQNSIRGILQK